MGRAAPLPLDDLVVYAVWQVIETGEECTFERLVYECFTRFPEAFALRRYPEWPDSARVNKAWLRARTDKGWLVGSVQEGFRLTEAGELAATRAARLLKTGRAGIHRASTGRSRERFEALLKNLRTDSLFRTFQQEGNADALTEMDFRRLLGATLETPGRILRQNLKAYLNAAAAYEDHDVIKFLRACEDKMAPTLGVVKESNNGGERAK